MFRRRFAFLVTVVALIALGALPALACLWDYDTLRDERRGLPGVAEILAGKWERHSAYFYEQRRAKMEALIAKEPENWDAYDNLAVAVEKLGDFDGAIAVMEKKESLKPGEYTTYANLGTFHLHKGDFDRGIPYIEKALQINPAAHFGREEYQLKLAVFLRDRKRDPQAVKVTNFLFYEPGKTMTQDLDQIERGSPATPGSLGIKQNAVEGIVGILRFGTGKSPDLFYALGDILAYRGDKNLAYRAYQRAIDLGHPQPDVVRERQKMTSGMIEDKSDLTPERIAGERAAADAWVAAFQAFEDDLLRKGGNVDDEKNYAPFYAKHGSAITPERRTVGDMLPKDRIQRRLITIVLPGVLLTIAGLLVLRIVVRRIRRSWAGTKTGAPR